MTRRPETRILDACEKGLRIALAALLLCFLAYTAIGLYVSVARGL